MRHLWIQIPEKLSSQVENLADEHKGKNVIVLQGQSHQESLALVSVSISNHRIQSFLDKLQELNEAHVTFAPQGVFALYPPHDQAPDQVTDIEERSPIEVLLGGLQSIGSWQGFLGYATIGGIVAWIGLFTDSIVLLIASMLIAPFAGPAMNLAVASAHGDLKLLRHSVVRYFAALSVSIVIAALLSAVIRQNVITSQMTAVAKVSIVAALIPIAAGAAGAVNLIQSERSSLVTGAATGVLIAATLAPVAALIGMALAIQEWSLIITGGFLLLLQLFGIHLAGALVFRYYGGMMNQVTRYERGRQWVFPVSVVISLVAMVGLLIWQLTGSPDLFRSTREQRAVAVVQEILSQNNTAHLVEANLRFTQPNITNQNTLLGVIYVQKATETELPVDLIDQALTEQIEERLITEFDVTPLIDVQVMTSPPDT
jgi:uncharacterized hydrophobic protein (TIGR00341 family)